LPLLKFQPSYNVTGELRGSRRNTQLQWKPVCFIWNGFVR